MIGVAIGHLMNKGVEYAATEVGVMQWFAYVGVFSYAFFRYVLHGIPEIAAYLIAGLAGGIFSYSLVHHGMSSRKFKHVAFDCLTLMFISIMVLFLAGLLEVFVTPLLF